MGPSLIVKEIRYPEGNLATDSLMFREKCNLLLPELFTQNLFYSISRSDYTRYFLATSSETNMRKMETFFDKIYKTDLVDGSRVEFSGCCSTRFRLKRPLLKEKEFYYPSLLRNLSDLSKMEKGSAIWYAVTVRAGQDILTKRRGFGVAMTVSFDSEKSERVFLPLIAQELRNMKRETGVGMKRMLGHRIKDTPLHIPFNLINFVRMASGDDGV